MTTTLESTNKNQGRLASFVFENGNINFTLSNDDIPQILLEAHTALRTGRMQQAKSLLNDNAVEIVRNFVEKNTSRTDVMFILAILLRQTGQINKAKKWYEEILQYEQNALVYFELGYICQCLGLLSQAMLYYKKAVETDPHETQFWPYLAGVLIETGQNMQGIKLFRKAIEKNPENAAMGSSFLYHLHRLPNIAPQMLFNEHKNWAGLHAPPTKAKVSHQNVPDHHRKLRIGYISPDFGMHPVTYFFEPLLDGHDRQNVEVYGYGNVRGPSEVTQRLERKFDYYRNIREVADRAVAEMIGRDQIDILVDLTGHTTDNRLLVLAYKPAPIQITYLGYLCTTAMKAIDYILTDHLADQPQSQKFYTEELVFLPDGFYCYRPVEFAPSVVPPPAIRNGYVTFGVFGSNCKVNLSTIPLWAQVLKANHNSRILLKFAAGNDRQVRDRYFQQFERLGISRKRVDIYPWESYAHYLKRYGQVDIILDTFPQNGATTTCEALWMGVPVISLVGRRRISRTGLSILSRVGLEFFTASTPTEYVAKAAALAHNLDSLAKLRASMRQRMTDTLCDAKAFTKQLEAAYRKMWQKWCEAKTSNSIV